ncbi:MAG: DUF4259 domain-containing protein [Deltaproteobacteria bacterium]|nr:DUF4259 domain-containing protein [Deltaproteobacteria bacterium]
MGTWAAGPFSNDSALDFVGDVTDDLIKAIEDFVESPEIDETFEPAFAAVALLNVIGKAVSAYIPEPEQVRMWRDVFLACYDDQIDGMDPDPKFKREHREALEGELDQLVQRSESFHAGPDAT